MATAATSLLGLALPVTGELSGTWGDTVNNSITSLLDTAVAGTTTLSSDADVTLTTTTLASNQARQAVLLWTAGGTVTRTITAPAQSKSYIVINKTSSSQSIKIVGVGPTTGVTIVAGTAAFVVWNGVDFVTASVTSTTGILPVANGGTGLASGTSGGVLAYTASGTLASSAALAASALVIGGGAGVAPSTTTTGTGVVTALGVNTGTAGAFVVNGGALGTPSSGTVTNLTGTASININGTVGATTATTGAFTSLTASTTLGVTGVSTLTGGAVVQGLTVGRGAGAVATNTAVGASALAANTTGASSVAVGYNAGTSAVTATENTFVGALAGQNIVGSGNVAFGSYALNNYGGVAANGTGTYNCAFGKNALLNNTSGGYNVALGPFALQGNTTASNNVGVGYNAGNGITSGGTNTFLGYNAGSGVTSGGKNVILGAYTGAAAPISATASNYIVFSDGDGTVRGYFNNSGSGFFSGATVDYPGSGNTNTGIYLESAGQLSVSRDNTVVARFNRNTSDGTLLSFARDGTEIGTISVSGGTVSYNAFAGSHWSQLSDGSKPDILRGTVLDSINELVQWPDEPTTERLCKVKVSDTAGSKKVYGVFMDWDNDWTATNDMYVTAVGAFICRVNASVTVQEGDLLESNGDGTAKVQADDIIRSSTIGKVTCTEKTHQYDDGSYCVPTVLYCG